MFSDGFFPELGGVQDSVATLAAALGRRGHTVAVHAPRYAARDFAAVAEPVREIDLGANVAVRRRRSFRYPTSTAQSRMVMPSPFPSARLARRGRPDVIHVHSPFGLGLEGLLAGALLGVPVVGTNHTAIGAFLPRAPVDAARWGERYFAWFYARCDRVTAPSRSVFDDLGGAARLRRACRVVSNPIDADAFAPVPGPRRERIKAELGLSGATVTYAGRLGPEKNLEPVLEAVALVAGTHPAALLAVAGHGSHEPALRRLAARLGIEARVRFLGTLGKPALARLLQASDVFVTMSTSETQGMALLQAMACGVAVVGARSRALPEYIDGTNGLLVPPHDHLALARALAWLLDRPDRRRDLGAGGRRSAERCGVGAVTTQWEAIYLSMREEHRGR